MAKQKERGLYVEKVRVEKGTFVELAYWAASKRAGDHEFFVEVQVDGYGWPFLLMGPDVLLQLVYHHCERQLALYDRAIELLEFLAPLAKGDEPLQAEVGQLLEESLKYPHEVPQLPVSETVARLRRQAARQPRRPPPSNKAKES
jgi:hypothetical protein